MLELILKIKNEWMLPLRKAHLEKETHAPLEINQSPTLAHVDCNSRLFNQMLEEVFEFKESTNDYDVDEIDRKIGILDALGDEFYVWVQKVVANGMQDVIIDAILEIHESNLTKFQNGEAILNDQDKLMKPEGFKKPDLSKFIK